MLKLNSILALLEYLNRVPIVRYLRCVLFVRTAGFSDQAQLLDIGFQATSSHWIRPPDLLLLWRIQIENGVRLGRHLFGRFFDLHLRAILHRHAAPVADAGVHEDGLRLGTQADIQRQARIAFAGLGVVHAAQHVQRWSLARVGVLLAGAVFADGLELFREGRVALGVVAHARIEAGVEEGVADRTGRLLFWRADGRLFFLGHGLDRWSVRAVV